jgi:uncharacterized protein
MTFFAEQRFRLLISASKTIIQARDSLFLAAQNRRNPQPKQSPPLDPPRPITISHHDRNLEAQFASPTAPHAAVLFFHGIGERLHYWNSAQTLLAKHNIASLIFHYSGYGRSTGALTPHNLQQDAHAAYATLISLLPPATPIYLLGYSLGTGIVTDAALHLTPSPAGLILCQPFTSLRAAAASYVPAALSSLLPDIFHTHRTIVDIALPLLIVHGDADELFPISMAQQIHAAATTRSNHTSQLIHPPGYTHNQAYLQPSLAYWQPIIDFTQRP